MRERARFLDNRLVWLVLFLIVLVLFFYSSLNLQTIDYGYKLQALLEKEKSLREEIDRLRAERSCLLSAERVERLAMDKLGYRYPESKQIIKVKVAQHAN
jgi:cell division protein FtsL